MSTPTPPPSPYSAPASLPMEPEQPRLSEGARLINVFIAPRKTFEDIRRNASWWAPWLVTAVFSVLMAAVIVQKVDLAQLATKRMEMSKMGQTQLEQMTPAQKERVLGIQVLVSKIQFFARPIITLIVGLVTAAILIAIFNFGFAAEVSFPRALAVVFYAGLPVIVRAVLVSLSLLLSSDPSGVDPDINPIATNPAFFMDRDANKFLYGLASGLDAITIWTIVLTGIGLVAVSANRKLKLGTVLTTLFVIYGALVLAGAAVGSAF